MQFNSKADIVILAEDILIVLDQYKQISALEKEMRG